MAGTAEKTDPKLWDEVKQEVVDENKGGKAGQWSARKAQLAVQKYKGAGGGYKGRKTADNHLAEWTRQDWGTASGKQSGETGERYLPKRARESISREEYNRATAKKRADSAKGRQFSSQPADVARKTARAMQPADGDQRTRLQLLEAARRQGIKGRSRMNKAALQRALGAAS